MHPSKWIARILLVTMFVAAAACAEAEDDAAPDDETPAEEAMPTEEPEAGATSSIMQPGGSMIVDEGLPAPAPSFEVETLTGASFSMEEHRGNVVLVNFWATWCPPCIVEIPDFIEMYESMADDGLTILGISVEEGEEDAVRGFVEEFDIPYDIAISMGLAEDFGGVQGLPTTYVIDKEGQIVHRIIGLFPTEDLLPEIRELLDA